MKQLLLCIVALIIIAICSAGGAAAQPELALVQVIHRHGARTPVAPFNKSLICGDIGCGMLTDSGKEMLTSLGTYIREKYYPADGSGPLSLPSFYDPTKVVSRSTDIPRTLQSSDAMHRGLYPNQTQWYPVIHTKPLYDDQLLVVNALPSFTLISGTSTASYLNVAEKASKFFTQAELAEYGSQLHADSICANTTNPLYFAECAMFLSDICVSYYSMGILEQRCPKCAQKLDLFHKVIGIEGEFAYLYNISNPMNRQSGSFGQNLVKQVLEVSKSVAVNPADAPVFYEYSGHDTTLMPFMATLGFNKNVEFYEPNFAQAIVIETYVDKTTKEASISAYWGSPNQTYGSDHQYTFQQLKLNGLNATSGITYEAEMISITDIAEFAKISEPLSPAGYCYAPKGSLAVINCTTDAAPTPDVPSVEAGGFCAWYRSKCPLYGCPAGTYVYPGDYSCHKL